MSNILPDTLFQLINSLEKSEKRHFKLYIKRSSAKEDLKVVRLFDAMDALPVYEENHLLKKLRGITKPQLSNLKTHLYKQLLASLRLLKTNENTDLKLSEHLDNARLLYNKGLKLQSLQILEKAKDLARTNQKFNFLVQAVSLEKKIETLHITRSSLEKTELLAEEAVNISEHIYRVTHLSNLALLLYRWYVQNGHARNEQDEIEITKFFKASLPANVNTIHGFYEKLYLYQSYCWYAFIRQDFLMYYRYSQKWIDLFDETRVMVAVETGHYIKGMHNLLNAHFDLRNFKQFDITLKHFERFSKTSAANQHDNFRTHTSIYINNAKINQFLMLGNFSEGLAMVPEVVSKLEEYSLFVDSHRILVFNYKIASLYFGAAEYSKAIDFLHKIINDNRSGLRYDLQCYARLMHLLCHYEMGNEEIMESLIKSVYRFMAKMKNLTVVEEEIFSFLRHSLKASAKQLKPELNIFLKRIKHLEKNRFETRSFAYLDIISWIESKVFEKPMSQIIHNKFLRSKHRKSGPKKQERMVEFFASH
jgi:tetratricopeptide (TPR) repeat protein